MRKLSVLFIGFSLTVTMMVSADPFPFAPFPPAPDGAFAVTVDDAAVSLLTAQGTSDPFLGTSDPFVDAMDSLLTTDPVAALPASVPCEPGLVYWESRNALGRLLKWTASDLRGTKYRAPWFQAFPWTKSFPEAGEVAGAKYRYNSMGTVGLVKSTSPWPLQYNWGPLPTDEAACVVIARGFLRLWGDLIMLNGRMQELVVDRVTIEPDGEWSVVFGQEYQDLKVLGASVMINGDEFGDVFTMQSNYVPNLAVDVVPTYGTDALGRILAGSGNPHIENGFEYIKTPELTVAHTASDPCAGTLLWSFGIFSWAGIGPEFSYAVDAHRGEVYGYNRLDSQDVEEYQLYNFRGNHEFRTDLVQTATIDACGPGGAFDCHWFSTPETNKANVVRQSLWDPGLIVTPLIQPPASDYWSSRKCWSYTPGCNTGGFPFDDPQDHNGDILSATGNHYLCYDTTDPYLSSPYDCWIENDPVHNPWRIYTVGPGANNEYNAGKWLVDDLDDFVAYINHMETELSNAGVTSGTLTGDISFDFPVYSVLASEPRDTAIFDGIAFPWDDERHYPFFWTAFSGYSKGSRWGNQRILISPSRYNRSFDGGNQFAADDTVYHEIGHMLQQGFPESNYYRGYDPLTPSVVAPQRFDHKTCVMWKGIHHESMPDLYAALIEYYRFSTDRVIIENGNTNSFIDIDGDEYKPDWNYGEGLVTGPARDMQRPDHADLDRFPESLNDFKFRRTSDATLDYRDAEIHGASGLIGKFNFLFGNDICDKDNRCGENANELVNDPCTCGAADANTPVCYDDPLNPRYQRANDRFHTVMPPSSCQLNGSTETPGDTTSEGFQQYHCGVEVTSLDRTHEGGENGLERLGRLYFRMLFDPAAITYEGDEFLPYAFMDAVEDALMNDTGWSFPDPFAPLIPFYRARDAVGFWTEIGNYFPIQQTIADEGLSAAFVNWKPGAAYPMNTEWIFGFEPSNHTIYLALRLCWNTDADGDGDMDYCLANPNWYYYVVEGPAMPGVNWAKSVPSVDVNDEGDPNNDSNHGLWIVYNATILAATTNAICKRQVPISPNTGTATPRDCNTDFVSDLRPGAGHYLDPNASETREVIVFADASDSGKLKSFEWGQVTGDELTIPQANIACGNSSIWRPEVVNHDGYVWVFWTAESGLDLCYSRLRHDDPNPHWEDPHRIPFEGDFDTCGTQSRRLNGAPEAETRNGIINLVVRDVETANTPPNDPWVWMIQLSDQDQSGIFEECRGGVEECAGDCRADCSEWNNYEERSNWVPHTEFYVNPDSPEVGALASTEHLLNMKNALSGNRQDYTFFYNPKGYTDPPIEKASGFLWSDLSVWVRESW